MNNTAEEVYAIIVLELIIISLLVLIGISSYKAAQKVTYDAGGTEVESIMEDNNEG